ncbi:SWIM zinc finger family protein [Halomarina halobia]|uniref:SWIM zinc finger family protein n=1 Tax=Halomarina halobia TaxID=3033386 RepID=A0ABD6AGR2_9EURY|nr:SWIM zinc finger family protein [Halomarina sp. PSR21]
MATHLLTQLEPTTRTIKRAQYEAFEFQLRSDGILVRNGSHATPEEHEYLVRMHDGVPVRCNCPADRTYSGACKHRIAVAIRQPVLQAATEREIIPDGGTLGSVADVDQAEEAEDIEECACAGLNDAFPCRECYQTGKRSLPE